MRVTHYVLSLTKIVVCVFLAGCASQTQPRGQETPATAQTAVAATAPATANAITATKPASSPTPDFMGSALQDGFLFTQSNTGACKLPCWRGLRIGQSTKEDVQIAFDNVFPSKHDIDFFD